MKKENNRRGSITLEAAIVTPIFIMIMLFVNGLFVMFMGQQMVAHTLIQSAKSMAFDPYTSQRVEASDASLMNMFNDFFALDAKNYASRDKWYEEGGNVAKVAEERFLAYLAPTKTEAEEKLDAIGIPPKTVHTVSAGHWLNGIVGSLFPGFSNVEFSYATSNLDFSESKVEDGILTVTLKYKQEFIFNMFDLGAFDREMTVQVKLFEYKE